ncbi:MAG: putative ABC transporter ATP-binding protein YbbA [Plesiomonas sp.]|uniref:putative ABC transporter ATP-binding protein YbbA n=1 Tax=Plesiomonas sp. TaxID=2486279 RepID=UPI003EE57959
MTPESVGSEWSKPEWVIDVHHLTKRVSLEKQHLTILNALCLQVKSGESLALTGASGSGKSTLLGILAGLDTATEGEVYLLGQELGSLDEEGRAALRAQHVGFVFQSFMLVPTLTALENVQLPLLLRGEASAESAAKASALLTQLGLGARLQHLPALLSGGEQQRVALARAFIGQPAILFADEPTGNLDAQTGRDIADLLFTLNRDFGTTLVLVTHDPLLAARCDRNLVLRDGTLEAQ